MESFGGADEEALKNSHLVGIPWYDRQLLEFLRGNIAAESSVSELLIRLLGCSLHCYNFLIVRNQNAMCFRKQRRKSTASKQYDVMA